MWMVLFLATLLAPDAEAQRIKSRKTEGLPLQGSDPEVYRWYTAKGERIDYDMALRRIEAAEVILFGELHDHPVIHWLQLRTAKALVDAGGLVLGGEMFEADNQIQLDEYCAGLLNDKRFEADTRLWPNYKTDYRPLVQLARSKGLRFIATNVPRRYAGMVSQLGLDTLSGLSDDAKALMAPLPMAFSMDTPGYREMLGMMHGGAGMGMNPDNFVKAQALKDATMAHFILKNLRTGARFLHFNGDYHSASYGGIYWYLKQAKPSLNVLTVKVFSEDDLSFQPDWASTGDLILVVADDFTRTH
jgi:uncharacterized iron-regulated protein